MAGRLFAGLAVVILFGLAIVYVTGNAGAGPAGSPSIPAAGSDKRSAASLSGVEQIALKSYPGTIMKSKMEHDLYEIIIKTVGGKVVKLKVDPADGSIVSFREKRKQTE